MVLSSMALRPESSLAFGSAAFFGPSSPSGSTGFISS